MRRSAQPPVLLACLLTIGVMIAGHSPGAAAQAGKAKPPSGSNLNALYATSVDVAEGKRLADANCARCHGASGISATAGVPHLAGQRPAYLHVQLRAYQQSTRVQRAMDEIVRHLSDDALVKVAAYYASLDPARPIAAAAKPAPSRPDPVQAGKTAAAACAGCHGEGGVSKTPTMPSLVSLDPKYFAAAMSAYKSGQRKHDMMKSLAAGVSDADLSNIALYYALQKPARAQTPAPGDPAVGKAAAAACSACHGDTGVSGTAGTPSIAGQDAQYLAATLRAYKDGSRKDESMKGAVAGLDERAITNLAAFYAAQSPKPVSVRKPLALADWVERCERCHGVNGNSTDPLVPGIAAQRADWLEQVLQAYRTGARKSSVMAAMSASLTEADAKDLAAHYARQTARAVTYVVVPAK